MQNSFFPFDSNCARKHWRPHTTAGPGSVGKATSPVRRLSPGLQAPGASQAAWPAELRRPLSKAVPRGKGRGPRGPQGAHTSAGPARALAPRKVLPSPGAGLLAPARRRTRRTPAPVSGRPVFPALLKSLGEASHGPSARWPGARLALQDEPASREGHPHRVWTWLRRPERRTQTGTERLEGPTAADARAAGECGDSRRGSHCGAGGASTGRSRARDGWLRSRPPAPPRRPLGPTASAWPRCAGWPWAFPRETPARPTGSVHGLLRAAWRAPEGTRDGTPRPSAGREGPVPGPRGCERLRAEPRAVRPG